MKILRFETGRGGRFNNAGHVTFHSFETVQETSQFDHLYFSNDRSSLIDESSNELDFEINDDGTGYLDQDGEYDTTHWVKEDDLNNDQIQAIIVSKYAREELLEIIIKYSYDF